jgi:hypothetical protein
MSTTVERADRSVAGGGALRIAVRVVLWFMAVVEALVGVWAQFWPDGFYAGFPLPGHDWVGLLPPYNEHLVRDVGGLSLALVVVLVAAAVRTDRFTVRVAALAMLAFTLPHTVFHASHLEHFPPADATAQTVGTIALTVLTLGLLAVSGRLPAGRS